MAKEGSKLTITKPKPFLDAAKKVVDQLQNTLGTNEEAKPFIKRISEAAMDATQFPSAEKMMNFYKQLNGLGKWMGRSEKDRLLTDVKNGIKDTFRSEGKAGKEFADKFEKSNAGIKKAYEAEELVELIEKSSTQNGLDYNKLNKIFDKKDNVQLFEDVLGKTQAKNLKLVANTGKEIKDFDKAWKAVNNFKIGTGADTVRGVLGSYFLYQGDWESLAGVVATKAGSATVKKLAEMSLTDPYYQNLWIRGLHAIKNSSPKSFASANAAMNKYLEDEGIDISSD